MGDFQKFEQDFYLSGYYIDDQGQVALDYNGSDPNPEYEDDGIDVFMPGVFAPSMGQPYTGQVYQPTTPAGTYQYTAGTDGSYEEELPLLEDGSIMNETDLTSPILFCITLGATLLMASKSHFGYVYGISAIGCMAIYTLLTLMSSLTVSYGCVASVLGYCLPPHGGTICICSRLFPTRDHRNDPGLAGDWLVQFLSFISTLAMEGQQLLVAYPCAMLYGVFALLTVF
ncbi:unnamed protein product [Coregonus sp. 'balchen']|nr:unnamed protein product [Coregonus sp. 'balchen']